MKSSRSSWGLAHVSAIAWARNMVDSKCSSGRLDCYLAFAKLTLPAHSGMLLSNVLQRHQYASGAPWLSSPEGMSRIESNFGLYAKS